MRDIRRRGAEAARLGFTHALVPAGALDHDPAALPDPGGDARRPVPVVSAPLRTTTFSRGFDVTEAETVWDALTHVT